MSNQQSPSLARVVLFTADACITGDLATGGDRVKDVLNLPQNFLELTRLNYSNPDRPGVPLVDYPSGTLRKSDIGCLIVLSEPPQATMRKLGVYVQKKGIRVAVLIPGMVVVGTLHIQGRYDPTLLLTDGAESFVPLTQAGVVRARTTTPAGQPPERLTVFVNRAHISGILLSEPIEQPSPAPEPARRRAQPLRRPTALPMSAPMPMESQETGKTGLLRRFNTQDGDR